VLSGGARTSSSSAVVQEHDAIVPSSQHCTVAPDSNEANYLLAMIATVITDSTRPAVAHIMQHSYNPLQVSAHHIAQHAIMASCCKLQPVA
jgi:hypothetical protein